MVMSYNQIEAHADRPLANQVRPTSTSSCKAAVPVRQTTRPTYWLAGRH